MSESEKPLTPPQQLARRIVVRLANKGLLGDGLAAQIEAKIAEGKMQSSDWKLTFEKSLGFHKKL